MYYILYALSCKLGLVRTSIKYTIHCQMLSLEVLLLNIVSVKCGLDIKNNENVQIRTPKY